MSFFSDASLVYVPSGVKNAKTYSIKPTDGSGDLTFSRASNATRVNSSGLVEKVRTNLFTYSEQIDNASWIKSDTTIVANAVANPLNGAVTADKMTDATTSSATRYTYQSPASSGTIYTSSGYFKKAEYNFVTLHAFGLNGAVFNLDTGVKVSESGGVGTITSVGSGWYRCTFTFTAGGAGIFFSQSVAGNITYAGTAGSGIYAFGLQAETGDIATDYIATTSAAVSVGPVSGLPRLDYSGGASCPSLLLEGQRSNLVTFSEQMTLWANGAASVTANATTSPDGYQNADSINNTADVSTFVTAANGVYTWSLFVKQGTSASASIDMSDGATGDVITTFTFATKTFSGTTAGGSWTSPSTAYQDYGNGWYRISLTATKGAGSSIGYKIVASGTGTTFVWGAQLEAGAYATSYIPTLSSAVTRVADAAYKTGIGSLFGASAGTIYFETTYYPETNTGSGERWVYAQGATSNDYIRLWQDVTGGAKRIRALVNTGGVQQVNISTLATSLGLSDTEPRTIKFAFAYADNDFRMYVNGNKQEDTAGTAPTITEINYNNTFQTLMPLAQALVFPTALSDADCITLTA